MEQRPMKTSNLFFCPGMRLIHSIPLSSFFLSLSCLHLPRSLSLQSNPPDITTPTPSSPGPVQSSTGNLPQLENLRINIPPPPRPDSAAGLSAAAGQAKDALPKKGPAGQGVAAPAAVGQNQPSAEELGVGVSRE